MHVLTLSSLTLALGTLAINAQKMIPRPLSEVFIETDPDRLNHNPYWKPKEPPPSYDWEHRTTCKYEELQRNDDVSNRYSMIVVGYAWDESNAETPDHRWNWNTTRNAEGTISRATVLHGGMDAEPVYKFESGQPDERGFMQFTAEVSVLRHL
jgi:hypothetical protein